MRVNRRPKPKFRHYVQFNSGVLQRGSYCPVSQVLELDMEDEDRYCNTYRFYDVDEAIFIQLFSAPSAGSYFAHNIRGRFFTKKFDPDGGAWRTVLDWQRVDRSEPMGNDYYDGRAS
jgi:KTSC domain-containing protein